MEDVVGALPNREVPVETQVNLEENLLAVDLEQKQIETRTFIPREYSNCGQLHGCLLFGTLPCRCLAGRSHVPYQREDGVVLRMGFF